MKYFIILLLFLSINSVDAQINSDSTLVANTQLINLASRIKELERNLDLRITQVNVLQNTVISYEALNKQNEAILEFKNKEIEIYERALDRIIDFPKKTEKKWYETKEFTFIAGIVTGTTIMILSSHLVSNLN
jgi:hypothetical protein